jgi:large repetitive protein
MRKSCSPDSRSFLDSLLNRLFSRKRRKAARRAAARGLTQRTLLLEPLEGRQLLASDLASLTGVVSLGTPVDGATIELYRDLNTNGIFEPGAGDGAALAIDTTDATGTYRFDGLEAGDYFIHQPAQTVGAIDLGAFVTAPITITALDAEGVAGTVVDDFDDAIVQLVTATDALPDQNGAADHAGALGGERDMRVELTSGGVGDSFAVQSTGATLTFNSSLTAQGRFSLVYDGDDNDATTTDFTGLGGEDLTAGGATVLQVRVQADQPDATLRLRVYTDADNFSETAAFSIPGTNTPTDVVFDFASFVQGGGATGPADFTNVGAIEMIVETATDGTDGLVTLLGAFGPTILAEDITNEADLQLSKAVSDPTPNVGDDVTFTLTLTNPAGGAGATNVEVTDLLPAGLTFVSATASQGTYDEVTGVWTVGDLAADEVATLEIVASVAASGITINDAEITAADQPDPDTGNNADSANVDVPPAADLRLTKDVDDTTPDPNQTVEFTITVTNDGPDQATGVEVTDLLPAGLSFVGATESQGTYNDATGLWLVGTIDSGNSATLTIQAEVTSNDPITNIAEISASDQFDPDSTPGDGEPDDDDYAEITIDVPNIIDLELEKDVDNATPNVGDSISFTLTLTNAGPEDAAGVFVTDLLPSGLAFDSAVPSQGTYDEATGIWDVGTVAASQVVTLLIMAQVTASGTLTNDAEVTACIGIDLDSVPGDGMGDDFDTIDVVVPPAADLSLTKEIDDTTPGLNQQVVFTITVSNSGPDQATGVEVTDLLPAGLDFVSANPSQGTYDELTGVWLVGTIDNAGQATLEITATVSTLDPVTNTAEVTAGDQFDPDSTPGNSEPGEDDQASVTIDVAEADLELAKTVDNATPNLGQTVTFTLTLDNLGPDEATGVEVTDLLPAGLSFQSATPSQGAYDDATGVWTVGTVAASGSATLDIVALVTATGVIANEAEVTASEVSDPDSTPNDATGDDFASQELNVPAAADLSLTKTVDNDSPLLNDEVVFTLTLINNGPDEATGVVVADLLPAGLSFVSANASQGTYDENTGIWLVGTVADGAVVTLAITAAVTTTDPVTNTGEVTGSDQFDPNSTPGNNEPAEDDQDSVTVDVPESADLELTKDVDDDTPLVGQIVTFTITLNNVGPDSAVGVEVTDQLPAGLTFQNATPSQGSYDDATGIWTVGTLAASGSATLAIEALVAASGTLVNDAEVTASAVPDPDSTPNDGAGDDFDSVTLNVQQAADLSLIKDVDDPTPNFGDDVTFTLTLTNSGPDEATGVVVTDQLPAGLTFQSATPSGSTTYNSATGIWTVGTLASGGTATLVIVAQVDATGQITNEAEVTASDVADPDSTPGDGQGDDFDSVDVDVPAAADLSITKTASSLTPNFGSNVTFTITVTNSGPNDATGVEVTDLLPAGLDFQSATPSQGTYDDATGVWTVGTIADGATATLTIVAEVTSTAPQVNSAEVTASDQFDPDSTPDDGQGDDFASVTVDAPAAADLSLTKTVNNATPNLGSNVTFTVTLTNSGPDTATNVVVADSLPAGLTLQSSTAAAGTTYNSTTGAWTIPSLASGANVVLTLVARVDSTAALTNTAEVIDSDQFDPDSTPDDGQGDDFASVTVDAPAAADLRLAKTASATTVQVGQQVTFTVTVTNDGPDQATGVEVLDLLPAGLTFVGSTQSQGSYNSGTGVWTVGTLANGASATLTLTATLTASSAVTNTAQVSASDQFDPDSTPNNNVPAEDDQASTTVSPAQLSKRMFLAR